MKIHYNRCGDCENAVISGDPKEIADLAAELQNRQCVCSDHINTIKQAFQKAIDGIVEAAQDSLPQSFGK